MPMDLTWPPPYNLLVRHSALGVCYICKEPKGMVIRSADHGGELLTMGVDLKQGWTLYHPTGGNKMFHVFDVKLQDGTQTRTGASAPDEKSAAQIVRAKLGLDANTELKCCDCICDANTATFDDLKKAATMNQKLGGDDSAEAMQRQVNNPSGQVQSVDPNLGLQDPKLQVPKTPSVPVPGGQSPAQAPTNPSAPRIPPENAPGDSMHPGGEGQPTGNV